MFVAVLLNRSGVDMLGDIGVGDVLLYWCVIALVVEDGDGVSHIKMSFVLLSLLCIRNLCHYWT